MSLFSDIIDKATGKNLKKAYEMTEEDFTKDIDEVYDPNKAEEPTNLEKGMAILRVLYEKSIGKHLKRAKKFIQEKVLKNKTSFIAGALTAVVLLEGAGIIKGNIDDKKMQDQIRETILKRLVNGDTVTLLDKYGNPATVYQTSDGEIMEVVNKETKPVSKIDPKKVVINLDNPDRYKDVFPYGTHPFSEPVRAYVEAIVTIARNSGVSPESELRKFFTSFTQRTELQDDKAFYDYITSIIVTYMNGDEAPNLKQINEDIEEKGIETIYGGSDENNSPRR